VTPALAPAGSDFLDAARARFARAAAAAGGQVVDLVVGGHPVRLCFAGPGMPARVLPALAHLRAPGPARPRLVVWLWDQASTGVAMAPPPWPIDTLGPDGTIPAAAPLFACYQLDTGLVQIVDAAAGAAVVWLPDAADLPRHEVAAPLRTVFAAAFERAGLCVTHAAAVGRTERGGVLLGGRGGSGKSTTALLGLLAGLDFAGDDYVLVDPAACRVHGLYATAKLAGSARVPALAAAFAETPPPGEKRIAHLSEHAAERLSRGFPIRSVLLPRVGAATRVMPISAAAALRGLAPSTIMQYNGTPAVTLAALRRLVAQVPCLALELGPDGAEIQDLLVRLVDGAAP
jgi:hypothetical protein